jgi:elongation factor G
VPYRETIRGKADVQGRHKKQTGGHGQYGDCKIKMEPMPRGGQFEFVNDIFGGAIPKNYIPAIEKGIKDAAARGYLAGFPVVDFRVILYDGSYHDVDSNDMSFQMAGRIAFRKAMEQAKPTIAGAGDDGRDHDAGRLCGLDHGRPEQPAGTHPGHGQ